MSVQIRGNNNVVAEVESNVRAQRVVPYGPDVGSNGIYRVVATSGALTAVAAKTASAGHCFAFRWDSSSKLCLIESLSVRANVTTSPSSAQEFGFAAFMARSYTANSSGGTALTMTTNNAKLRASYATSQVAEIRIGTTDAFTAGTYTLDAQPFLEMRQHELVAAATVQKTNLQEFFDGSKSPIVLAQNEGFVITNSVLMANSLAVRLVVSVQWREVDSYAQ